MLNQHSSEGTTRTVAQLLNWAIQQLTLTSPSAELDAEVLLAFALEKNRAWLKAWPEKTLSPEEISAYRQLIHQRKDGHPVAHLTQHQEFWSLDFLVTPDTLIPRPDTETLVDYVVQKFTKQKLKVLDMGTGSGAIAIALASEKPGWEITATDVSPAALEVARQNATNSNTPNISFIESNWFSNLDHQHFDLIVSNPPYIPQNDPHLKQGDVRFEPVLALTSGNDGMNAIELLCAQASNYLIKPGALIIEHGYDQKNAVAQCFSGHGFETVEQIHDLAGHPRVTAGFHM